MLLLAKENMICLKGVPAMSQETLLLQELLYCVLENGGQHIVPAGIAFTLDQDMDQSLILRFLTLATNIVTRCEEMDRTDGLVNQALSAALELLLHDYSLLVC